MIIAYLPIWVFSLLKCKTDDERIVPPQVYAISIDRLQCAKDHETVALSCIKIFAMQIIKYLF